MRNSFLILFLILFLNIFIITNALPIRNESDIPEAIRALQNPKLLGGDMMGFDMSLRNAKPFDYDLWPSGTIPFVIDKELENAKPIITEAMNHFHQYTCIRFKPRTNENDYLHIFKDYGCYSYVGRTGGKQVLSLGNGCYYLGTIVHELMHAIGFYHEHNRSDRDNYLNIYLENIQPGTSGQFFKLKPEENRLLAKFDYNSIMLYGSKTFSKNGKPTMEPKYKNITLKEVNEKYGLTSVDIKIIQKLYKCLN